jgi:hypothetical protein
MNRTRHGFTIGIERTDDQFFLSLKAAGKLTHADYEMITPLIDEALGTVKHPHVRAFFDGTDLDGWEPRAAWDDFKLGLRHGNEFDKIAIFGNTGWQQTAARIGTWFVGGEVKYFEDAETALAWLGE